MGKGDAKLGKENEPSVMEDLFESILGAIYIDSGLDMAPVCRSVAEMLDISDFLFSESEISKGSSKSRLQEYCQDKKRRLPPPVYRVIGEEGPDHSKSYTVEVSIGEQVLARATGKSKKLAEKAAADEALKILLGNG